MSEASAVVTRRTRTPASALAAVGRALGRLRPTAAGLMIGPGLVVAIGFAVVVAGFAAWVVTHQFDLSQSVHPFIGLTYFRQILQDSELRSTLLVTVEYVGIALICETVLGVAIALLIYYGVTATRLVRALLLVPMVATPFVVGMVWRMIYDPEGGLLDGLFRELGIAVRWAFLSSPHTALAAVLVMEIWHWTPFVILIVLSGLEGVPRDLLEAVGVDGASTWQSIRHVVLPVLRPTIGIAMLLRAIGLTQAFTELYNMTNGGPGTSTMTFNIYDYQQGFQLFHIGYGTAVGVLYAIVIMATMTPVASRVLHLRRSA